MRLYRVLGVSPVLGERTRGVGSIGTKLQKGSGARVMGLQGGERGALVGEHRDLPFAQV